MIAILDANIGNLRSVFNAVYTLGYDAEIVTHVGLSDKHSHLIIPGVGSFQRLMRDEKMVAVKEKITSFANIGRPILGICLGMQMMGLHAGGSLDQFLPETLPTASDHWDGQEHDVSGSLGDGRVWSRHRQALASAGSLEVVATAFDGVIEAVEAPGRSLYLGVQWHPERTSDSQLGMALFDRLVHAAAVT